VEVLINHDGATIDGHLKDGDDGEPIEFKRVAAHTAIGAWLESRVFDIGLLPPAVRWISPDKQIVVFERPPMRQLVEYIPEERLNIDEENYARHRTIINELSIPWTLYICAFDKTYRPVSIRVFTRPTYMSSFDDPVYLLPLLNFYLNGELCFPGVRTFTEEFTSLTQGINEAYNMVWNSGWNLDLKDAITHSSEIEKPFSTSTKSCDSSWTEIIMDWHKKWSRYSIDTVLSMEFPVPLSGRRGGGYPEVPSVGRIIGVIREELMTMYPNSTERNFMINLATPLV